MKSLFILDMLFLKFLHIYNWKKTNELVSVMQIRFFQLAGDPKTEF